MTAYDYRRKAEEAKHRNSHHAACHWDMAADYWENGEHLNERNAVRCAREWDAADAARGELLPAAANA